MSAREVVSSAFNAIGIELLDFSVDKNASERGRLTRRYKLKVRDPQTDKRFVCEWDFAKDLSLEDTSVAHLMAQQALGDIEVYRRTGTL